MTKHLVAIAIVLCALFGTAAAQPGPAAPSPEAAALRKTCVAAMNADPSFAGAIVRSALEQTAVNDTSRITQFCRDVDTIETHKAAEKDVAKNKRHVFMAYAAMWVIAALFLLYLFMRQQRLKAEIVQLRRELDAAAKDGK